MSVKRRIAVAALTLSAAGFGAWKTHESYVPAPMIPTRGDVPTIGYGSTHYEDGRPVRMSDAPISRQRAELLARNLLSLDEMRFRASLPGVRTEEHTSELQSLMRLSYAVFHLKKKKRKHLTSIQHKRASTLKI